MKMLINLISYFKVDLKAYKYVYKSTFLSFIFLISTVKLFAQNEVHCVCGKDPTPVGIMGSHLHMKREWMFSYRYMNMKMDDSYRGDASISEETIFNDYLTAPQSMNMNMHMLMTMYGVSDKLTFMGMVDYLQNDMHMKMLQVDQSLHAGMHMGSIGDEMNMKSNGIGDVKFSALYGLFSNQNTQLILTFGVNLPTGSIKFSGDQFDMMYKNKVYPYGMQMGSGTFDFLPGLTYLIERGSNTISAQLNSSIRPFYNKFDYHLGNSTNLNIWYARTWREWGSSSIRLSSFYQDKIKGSYTGIYRFSEPAANTMNYGGYKASIYLGTSCFISDNHRFAIEIGTPFYQYVNGIQLLNKTNIIVSYNLKM